jgi:hypothetical protein
MKPTPFQPSHEAFLRSLYAREVRSQAKLHAIANFLIWYAIIAAGICAASMILF